ncbi:MAG: hypothetical protein FWG58_01345 [Methanomassiliicoccaceae archaeon]|nr:hypothetical protein [Methanomassiliicoccaceae archaeon]
MTETEERTKTGTADHHHGSGTTFIDIVTSMVIKENKRRTAVREKSPKGIVISSRLEADRTAIQKVLEDSFNSKELSALSKYKKLEIVVDWKLKGAPDDYTKKIILCAYVRTVYSRTR